MRVAIGADHAGFELKEIIKQTLDELRVAYKDFGTDSDESVDYPDYAAKVGRAVAAGEFDRGILICGTGIGMALAANKIAGHPRRAGRRPRDPPASPASTTTPTSSPSAPASRRPSAPSTWSALFLKTEFEGGRHERRLQKVAALEQRRAAPP